jgi:hypothetical protein
MLLFSMSSSFLNFCVCVFYMCGFLIVGQENKGYVPWNDEMDKVLLDTFVDYYNKGDICQNGWKSHVYTTAVKNVCEKCNVTITKENISPRIKTFDKHYNIIDGLLSTSGFGWDWEKNKLKVDSDIVCDEYVEVRNFL